MPQQLKVGDFVKISQYSADPPSLNTFSKTPLSKEMMQNYLSTKLTNWYKTFVVENKNLHRLILLGANLKSQKYCYQIFGSIRQK